MPECKGISPRQISQIARKYFWSSSRVPMNMIQPVCAVAKGRAYSQPNSAFEKITPLGQLRGWNFHSIKPPCANENRYDHCSRSSRTYVCRVWLELLFKFHSHAAATARSGWGLFQGLCRQWLHVRCWHPATAERITIIDRPFRAACPDHSRRDDLQYPGI